MLKKNVLNILLMAILSISIVPTSLFSMEKTEKSNPTDQINEILHNLDQEQDEFIRSVLSTYRIVSFTKASEEYVCKTTNYKLFKDEEQENNLEEACQYLNDTIQERENNLADILIHANLNNNTQEELRKKIENIKKRQAFIEEKLEFIKNNKSDAEQVLNGLYNIGGITNKGGKKIGKKFKINKCHHYYGFEDSFNITITDVSRCPICEWDKNHQGEAPYKRPKVTEQPEGNNPPNRFNNWLRSYIWPTTKITLYTSCLILAVVLASRLFNLR